MNTKFGVVENRDDPMQLGRCQVRIMGLHTPDKLVLPTDDLPWAFLMQPATSAAMNGIGHAPVGLVPGTWVVVTFADDDCQQPIILGSIGGIPDISTISADKENDVITIRDPDSGITEDKVLSTSNDGTPNTVTSIPRIEPVSIPVYTGGGSDTTLPVAQPPIWWNPTSKGQSRGSAAEGIQAIIVAARAAGYTEKNAISAFLGIAAGESNFHMATEGFTYNSADRLKAIFGIFKTHPELAQQWVGKSDGLAEFVYGYSSVKGKALGNLKPGDGAKYIGRGFIQLTGLSNYALYAKLSGVDIVTNPELLNSDINACAKVMIAYFKRLMPKTLGQNDPKFFEQAVRVVGYCSPDIHATKLRYYQYFLGQDIPNSVASKNADGADIVTASSPGGDRTSNTIIGFSDPDGKYPLRSHLHEPDTNRLARGKIDGTCIDAKDSQRKQEIPGAFGESFGQPEAPFGASYPYNKVFESESGHVLEFDDSPGYERVNLFHRTGTFIDIDNQGTQVNKIVGDGYTIYDRNGYIYIAGVCNVTVDGSINILCNSEANIEVMGDANIDLRSDANIGITGDATVGIGGNVALQVNGNVDATVKGNGTLAINGNAALNIGGNMTTKVGGNLLLDIGGNMTTKVGGNYDLNSSNCALSASGSTSVKAGSNANIDGAQVHINSGSSIEAVTAAAPVIAAATAPIPAAGILSGVSLNALETKPRKTDMEAAMAAGETEEEGTTSSRAKAAKNIYGQAGAPVITESSVAVLNNVANLPLSCDIIKGMAAFQLGYVLSTRSSITFADMHNVLPADTQACRGKGGMMVAVSKQEVACNMKQVAENILERAYDIVGDKRNIIVTSSFRTEARNKDVWKPSSDHSWGQAVDMCLSSHINDVAAHYDFAVALQKVVPYDQLILEYQGVGRNMVVWVHCSYKSTGAKKQAFTMHNGVTIGQGFHKV